MKPPRLFSYADWKDNRVLFAVAAVFHLVGIVGIGLFHQGSILRATPCHLLLMTMLLGISFGRSFENFLYWAVSVALICFAAEWVGVHYGWLFGGYRYGRVLGPKLLDIPLLIGVNWVLVAAGAVSVAERFKLPRWATILAAASLATAYDFALEPLAVRLGYWMWESGRVPVYNYICWWWLSAASALLWQRMKLRGNLFAAGLFAIQILFFIVLRSLL